MARKKILRRNWNKYKRLGMGRKKKQKRRKASGIHNKIRERKKGYSSRPEIGAKKPVKEKIIMIRNIKDLSRLNKGDAVILRKIGKKKRKEIEEKAREKGVKIINLTKQIQTKEKGR